MCGGWVSGGWVGGEVFVLGGRSRQMMAVIKLSCGFPIVHTHTHAHTQQHKVSLKILILFPPTPSISGLVQAGGVSTSLVDSEQQWDQPNGWPNMQHMMVEGCRMYGGGLPGCCGRWGL